MAGKAATITKQTYSKTRGINPKRMHAMLADGLPVEKDGKINPTKADAWMARNIDPARQAAARSSVPSAADMGKLASAAEVRRAKMSIDARLAALELQKRQGTLVERVTVEKFLFERARYERDQWLGWVLRIAPDLAEGFDLDPQAVFAKLDKLVRDHLQQLSDSPTQLPPKA